MTNCYNMSRHTTCQMLDKKNSSSVERWLFTYSDMESMWVKVSQWGYQPHITSDIFTTSQYSFA